MSIPINDPTLVQIKKEQHNSRFFIALFLSIAALTLSWWIMMDSFIQFKKPFAFTTTEQNIASLVRELRTSNPDLAIVGSSLSKRLKPGLFTQLKVMNLSVGGGSLMTGLELLNEAPSLPKIILIEMNILDRPVDEAYRTGVQLAPQTPLKMMFSGASKPLHYFLSKPYFSYSSPEKQSRKWNNQREAYLKQKPRTYDVEAAIASGLAIWDKSHGWHIANQNIQRIHQLIPELERRGARVYFMYIPFPKQYNEHPYAKKNRELASGNEYFQCPRCIDVRRIVNENELRWEDGTHLDGRSAFLVANAIQKHLLASYF